MRRLVPLAIVVASCVGSASDEGGGSATEAASASGDDDGVDASTMGAPTSGPSGGTDGADDGADASDTGNPGPFEELDCGDGIDDDTDAKLDCYDDDCWLDPVCTERYLRVATWNVREVGPAGSTQHDALVAVLGRIDADVVCLNEVGDAEQANVDAAAAAAGYPYVALAPAEGGIIRNACLSRYALADATALDAAAITGEADANDMTRRFMRLRINLGSPIDRYVTVFAVHLKSGETDADRFRRMVEAVRLGQAIENERAMYQANAIVALGDFNETPRYPAGSWSSIPADMPAWFQLGADIQFPLTYEPFAPIETADVDLVHATVEDTSYEDTYLPQLAKLDYIYEDAGDPVIAEVYEACQDNGVDDNAVGDLMPKSGNPLPCGTNADASDHRPVIALLYFP